MGTAGPLGRLERGTVNRDRGTTMRVEAHENTPTNLHRADSPFNTKSNRPNQSDSTLPTNPFVLFVSFVVKKSANGERER